ncbi:MAG: glycine cleavage system aminomethyltransferase GcvT [Ignavibacteriae bacterium]|nr:MAG: glycine cleavage system aminomethyltransferase GcvT [Ignavibacteriota bacterium]
MKKTPFYALHTALGAKMVEFAGFEMPVQYSGIIEEHLAVRRSVGVFDVTHMGEFLVRGSGALAFLQKVTINDVARLKPGRVQYSAMCYEDGGIIDDLLIYRMEQQYMLVVNASNLQKDLDWLLSQKFGDVEIENVSDETALLAVQGPKSLATLQQLTKEDLSKIEYYSFTPGDIAGIPMTISRTGYTGELGFELYFKSSTEIAKKVWDAIFNAGKEFGIQPIGLGARDTLRLEMGFCLYGNDIDKTTNPLEAGLGWITKLSKKEFNGRHPMLNARDEGLKRKLVGFTLPERTLARHGYDIVHNGRTVGYVTSGTYSPSLKKGIGMGYISAELAPAGTVVSVRVREKEIPATIVVLPFLQNH